MRTKKEDRKCGTCEYYEKNGLYYVSGIPSKDLGQCRFNPSDHLHPMHSISDIGIREFSRRNRRRCEAKDGFNHKLSSWSVSDWFTALMGELGEAANLGKKLNRIRDKIPGNAASATKEKLRSRMVDELADTYIYLDLLFQAVGADTADAVERKFARTSKKIKYVEPVAEPPVRVKGVKGSKSWQTWAQRELKRVKGNASKWHGRLVCVLGEDSRGRGITNG